MVSSWTAQSTKVMWYCTTHFATTLAGLPTFMGQQCPLGRQKSLLSLRGTSGIVSVQQGWLHWQLLEPPDFDKDEDTLSVSAEPHLAYGQAQLLHKDMFMLTEY